MVVKKIYADADGMVTFTCQQCDASLREPVEKFKGVRGPINVKCVCGNSYDVQVEFRKFYRKSTDLEGLYFKASQPGGWGKMIVKNLSAEGCGFETISENLLQPGEEIKIEFQLNNRRRSWIRKKAIVLTLEHRYVGCRFEAPPESYDPDIGFYLRKT